MIDIFIFLYVYVYVYALRIYIYNMTALYCKTMLSKAFEDFLKIRYRRL